MAVFPLGDGFHDKTGINDFTRHFWSFFKCYLLIIIPQHRPQFSRMEGESACGDFEGGSVT